MSNYYGHGIGVSIYKKVIAIKVRLYTAVLRGIDIYAIKLLDCKFEGAEGLVCLHVLKRDIAGKVNEKRQGESYSPCSYGDITSLPRPFPPSVFQPRP